MSDKQIIIDGVDVSGCEFYSKDDKTCREVNGKYDTDICEFDKCENSNCYYKQLKRKEQECEALQMSDNEAREIVTELKAECEELKKELEVIHDDCKGCPTCNEALYNANLYAEEYRKLKQTFNRIKGIAEENIRIADLEGLNGVYRRGLAEQILQEISEVLDD